jgi:hypothetical protein
MRRYVIAKTSSDWRGPLNAISHIRRTFKADGLTLKKQECAKEKPVLAKALALPEPVEKDADQVRMLRAEVADLTELMMKMYGSIRMLRHTIATMQNAPAPAALVEVPTFLPPAVAPPPPPQEALPLFQVLQPQQVLKPLVKKPSVRSIKTINFVGDAWSSTDALARDMGLPVKIAYMKLYYLMKQDIIELSGGRWRKKPEIKVAPVVIATIKNKSTSTKLKRGKHSGQKESSTRGRTGPPAQRGQARGGDGRAHPAPPQRGRAVAGRPRQKAGRVVPASAKV